MTIKEQIDVDYIAAYKAKDITAKTALSSIKAAITIAFKSNGTWVATDDEIIKIINKGIKQREESQSIYEKAGREEQALAEAENSGADLDSKRKKLEQEIEDLKKEKDGLNQKIQKLES
jgi:uncharacterized protein YqeY